jgi:hypothetical protein
MYTFWGIAFTYFYQITYFAAAMAFTGEMEDEGRHALFGIRALNIYQAGFVSFSYLFLLEKAIFSQK